MYAREMTDLVKQVTTILHYVISIQSREFLIAITSDAISSWDDHSAHLSSSRETSDASADFRVSVPLPENILLKAERMRLEPKRGEYKKMNPKEVRSVATGVRDMDLLLEELFWLKVNHQLKQPLPKPRT